MNRSHVLQGEVRLSESMLWKLQEEYYAEESLQAWVNVPFYSTSRMMFVGANAELVNSFLLDYSTKLDYEHPVYILEVGGGSGCFAYRFVNELQELMSFFPQFEKLRVCYILSDFAQSNIDAHLKNPRLKPMIDAGLLELAIYRPDISTSIHLEVSDQTLTSEQIKNPLLVVANYFFDTIKHDAFRAVEGKLLETKFSVHRANSDAASDLKPRLRDLKMVESYHEIEFPYYDDPALDSILHHYQGNLKEASVIFPIGAMDSLKNLTELAGNKLVVIAHDKGFASLDSKQIVGLRTQEFAAHDGALSFDVNFDSLSRYFHNSGGFALVDSGDHSSLCSMFATSFNMPLPISAHYFRQNIQKRDVCNSSYNLEEVTFAGLNDKTVSFARPHLTLFISIVQASNFDPFIFDGALARLFYRLMPELSTMDAEQEREVKDLINRTAKNIFNVVNEYFDLAAVLEFFTVWGKHDECLRLANELTEALGPTRKAYDYAALSCEHLNRKSDAFNYFRMAFEMDPTHDWAKEGMERNKV